MYAGCASVASDLFKRIHRGLCVPAAVLLLSGATAATPRRATVFLVTHPELLVAYNAYQQTATQEELSRLGEFAPCVVLGANELLPDGFSRCMKVLADGKVWSFLRDSPSSLSNEKNAGIGSMIPDALIVLDTMIVGRESIRGETASGHVRILPAGTLVQRIFIAHHRTYARVISAESFYVWLGEENITALSPYRRAQRRAVPDEERVQIIIRSRIDASNASLRSLYGRFNAATGQSHSTPQWTIERLPGVLRCELREHGGSYPRSTLILGKDVENALLGTGCKVSSESGRIVVILP